MRVCMGLPFTTNFTLVCHRAAGMVQRTESLHRVLCATTGDESNSVAGIGRLGRLFLEPQINGPHKVTRRSFLSHRRFMGVVGVLSFFFSFCFLFDLLDRAEDHPDLFRIGNGSVEMWDKPQAARFPRGTVIYLFIMISRTGVWRRKETTWRSPAGGSVCDVNTAPDVTDHRVRLFTARADKRHDVQLVASSKSPFDTSTHTHTHIWVYAWRTVKFTVTNDGPIGKGDVGERWQGSLIWSDFSKRTCVREVASNPSRVCQTVN